MPCARTYEATTCTEDCSVSVTVAPAATTPLMYRDPKPNPVRDRFMVAMTGSLRPSCERPSPLSPDHPIRISIRLPMWEAGSGAFTRTGTADVELRA
jgi:hypothetical protein